MLVTSSGVPLTDKVVLESFINSLKGGAWYRVIERVRDELVYSEDDELFSVINQSIRPYPEHTHVVAQSMTLGTYAIMDRQVTALQELCRGDSLEAIVYDRLLNGTNIFERPPVTDKITKDIRKEKKDNLRQFLKIAKTMLSQDDPFLYSYVQSVNKELDLVYREPFSNSVFSMYEAIRRAYKSKWVFKDEELKFWRNKATELAILKHENSSKLVYPRRRLS